MRFPDARPWLARALTHPRVVVSLIALLVLAVPLGVLSHGLSDGTPGTVRLTGSTGLPSTYRTLTSNADFATGIAGGVTVSGGALRIGKPAGTRTWDGDRYEYATWTSTWQAPNRAFTQLIPSWSATTPRGSWIQVVVRVRTAGGAVSGVKDLGRWSTRDATFRRTSAGAQRDKIARVATDTLVATGKALTGYRITVRLMRTPGGASPTVAALGASTSAPSDVLPATSAPLRRSAVSLAVPAYSQMTHRGQAPQYGGGGEAWCSPTSLAMVLGYYGRLPAPSTYTWVPSRYADRWVNHVARLTYDYAYEGTGNWPFNTAYAATRVEDAFTTRLSNLRMAERFLRVGIPLVVSIRFARGELSGAPISATAGHLVVLSGFTAAGNPIVNDPAASSNSGVRRTYDRAQFERAWLRGSAGMAYVVRDAAHPLPMRPAGVKNW